MPGPANDHSRDAQFARDIDQMTKAIQSPGEGTEFSGDLLKKLYTLLYFGNLQFKRDGEWHPWNLPMAAAMCHGARITIQFPDDLSEELHAWLFEGVVDPRVYERLAATHGVSGNHELDDEEKVKGISEKKVPVYLAGVGAGQKLLSSALSSVPFGKSLGSYVAPDNVHYGVNLALGGAGNPRTFGKPAIIQNNGENGHLYLNYHPRLRGTGKGAMLVGIEQSAPHATGAHGHVHGASGAHHPFTATDGTDFAKSEQLKEVGSDSYYDGLFLNLEHIDLFNIKKEFANFNLQWLSETRTRYGDRDHERPVMLSEVNLYNPKYTHLGDIIGHAKKILGDPDQWPKKLPRIFNCVKDEAGLEEKDPLVNPGILDILQTIPDKLVADISEEILRHENGEKTMAGFISNQRAGNPGYKLIDFTFNEHGKVCLALDKTAASFLEKNSGIDSRALSAITDMLETLTQVALQLVCNKENTFPDWLADKKTFNLNDIFRDPAERQKHMGTFWNAVMLILVPERRDSLDAYFPNTGSLIVLLSHQMLLSNEALIEAYQQHNLREKSAIQDKIVSETPEGLGLVASTMMSDSPEFKEDNVMPLEEKESAIHDAEQRLAILSSALNEARETLNDVNQDLQVKRNAVRTMEQDLDRLDRALREANEKADIRVAANQQAILDSERQRDELRKALTELQASLDDAEVSQRPEETQEEYFQRIRNSIDQIEAFPEAKKHCLDVLHDIEHQPSVVLADCRDLFRISRLLNDPQPQNLQIMRFHAFNLVEGEKGKNNAWQKLGNALLVIAGAALLVAGTLALCSGLGALPGSFMAAAGASLLGTVGLSAGAAAVYGSSRFFAKTSREHLQTAISQVTPPAFPGVS